LSSKSNPSGKLVFVPRSGTAPAPPSGTIPLDPFQRAFQQVGRATKRKTHVGFPLGATPQPGDPPRLSASSGAPLPLHPPARQFFDINPGVKRPVGLKAAKPGNPIEFSTNRYAPLAGTLHHRRKPRRESAALRERHLRKVRGTRKRVAPAYQEQRIQRLFAKPDPSRQQVIANDFEKPSMSGAQPLPASAQMAFYHLNRDARVNLVWAITNKSCFFASFKRLPDCTVAENRRRIFGELKIQLRYWG